MAFVSLSLGLLTGCIDNDFDLSDLDNTIGIGNGELVLPSCSTDSIKLDEVLELNNSQTLVEQANGDYYYLQNGSDVSETHTKVNPITVFRKQQTSHDFSFSLADYLTRNRQLARATNMAVNITKEQVVYNFAYEGTMPDEVEKLTRANINGSLTIRNGFSAEMKAAIPVIAELTMEFPDFLTIGSVQTTQQYTIEGSKIVFHNVSTASDLEANIQLTQIDLTKTGSSLGSVTVNGKTLTLSADVKMAMKVNNIVADNISAGNTTCKISSTMNINRDMVITQVRGFFNPNIDLSNIGNTDVTGIPDFLTNDGVVIDIANPQILLTIESNLDVSGILSGTLVATKSGNKKNIQIPEFAIQKNATSKVCICRDKSKVDASQYTSVVEVANLSEVLNPIPDKIEFKGAARANNKVEADFELGKNYTLKPSYRIEAPLAFGENANIVYTDSFDDMNDDLKDLDVDDNTYLEMTGEVENKIPAYLNASAVAIGTDGNELSAAEVKVDVDGEIAASEDGKTAKVSTLKIKLTPAKGALKKLDGLKFTVSGSAKATTDGQPTIVGQTLNAKHHSLVVKNIKIKLVGKAIADLN